MKLYLIRHGETDWNQAHLVQGRTDIPLNETGRQQALRARQEIAKLTLDACITSPLKRAAETAKIVVDGRCPIIQNDLLKERSFGAIEGKNARQLDAIRVDWDIKLNVNTDGIEPIRDLFGRADAFLAWLKQQPYQDILICSHGSFLRALHYAIVGYDEQTDFLEWHIKNTEIDALELKR